ncbi:unnamed protein product [Peronospora destructor]|uniref:Uncharacterized protein n=1 Tax=Peronospora destructor TaxID=86335 RepID=A0AAV0TGB2_9STRA|nr:unnamed protein product [Peronospora destructor]
MTNDFFRHYRDDVQWMSDMGMSSFRFSISWSRVMRWDAETRRMQPNPRGIAYYHALLDALQTQLEPKGWLNPDIVTHFKDFAQLAFREFGGKVKYWATFNEPLTFISGGYGLRDAAPGAVEPSDTNTYTVGHNVLLSHAKAVEMFRALKGEETSVVAAGARIGIVLNAEFSYPMDESDILDVEAAERKMQFDLGWFMTPIITGAYPEIMRERVGERLPRFSSDEAALVKGSYDVFMFNNYYSRVVTNCDSEHSAMSCDEHPPGHARDRGIDDTRTPSGAHMPPTDDYVATIKWLHEKDPSTEILLTDNARCGNDQVNNLDRLQYFQVYVGQVYKAVVEEKIPIIGFTVWLPDTNERGSYEPQLDVRDANLASRSAGRLPRIPYPAAKWFTHLTTTKCLDGWEQGTVETDVGEQKETAAPREKVLNSEAGGNDVGVPWSLDEVIVLIVIGVIVLGAITCEAMRELRMSSRGSPEEVQVLITIKN